MAQRFQCLRRGLQARAPGQEWPIDLPPTRAIDMFTLLGMLVLGLIAGAIARFLVPGRDPLGILGTMLLGIVGSFVGGFLGSLLFERAMELRTTGLLGSIIGAVIALLVYRRLVDRRATA